MSGYEPVAVVDLEHEFPVDGVCRDLRFVPTARTAALLRRERLLVRERPGSMTLLREAEPPAAPEPVHLTFHGVPSEPTLWWRTELPPGSRPGDGPPFVLDAGRGEGRDGRRIAGAASPEGAGTTRAGAPAHREGPPGPPGALVELRLPVPGAGADPLRCAVRLPARRLRWKYFVPGDDPERFVRDRAERVSFDRGREALADRRIATTFLSRVELPLLEQDDLHLQLCVRRGGSTSVLRERLPLADAHRLGRVRIDDRPVAVAEVYLNG